MQAQVNQMTKRISKTHPKVVKNEYEDVQNISTDSKAKLGLDYDATKTLPKQLKTTLVHQD